MKYSFSKYTGTIRKNPENYWICSVVDSRLVFDSWEAKVRVIDKVIVFFLFYTRLLKIK